MTKQHKSCLLKGTIFMEIEGWIVQNFYASFMLIMLLIFQTRTTKLKTGRMYSNILICTLVLILSETIGRFFEIQGGKYLIFAKPV